MSLQYTGNEFSYHCGACDSSGLGIICHCYGGAKTSKEVKKEALKKAIEEAGRFFNGNTNRDRLQREPRRV